MTTADDVLVPGTGLPDFAMPVADGGVLTRADLAGTGAVLFFYPRDNTPGCTREAQDFSALLDQFVALGLPVIGISRDTPDSHTRFSARHGLRVTLASDTGEEPLSGRLGIWTRKQLYGRTFTGMVRTTLLIGPDLRIARIWRNVRVSGHAEAVLEAARQRVSAGWAPGAQAP
ncbi:peroxiredoxin [Erythrobacteraceae bacterium CFH 75059]|uniref:peroxiredoxin n=1 Tax=Qipengyuania thermophila TaxID=2509361 RepID=UPI00102074EF|nr:peroxiredoxin [Qipengyuania thermophila]TCD06569.1 peroxiredoxin [Erythrobacteraceae bacterium CFH 75059]